MNRMDRIAVCSRSFSRNEVLREELLSRYELVTFNEAGQSLSGESLVNFLKGHDKAITALEVLDEFVLSQLPQLRVIAKYGVGLDMIDMQAMHSYGKRLGWVGGVNRRSVSELVLAFAIALLRFVPIASQEVKEGIWRQHIGRYLSGKTVGIIGCGFIGKDLISLLHPFGCQILVNDIRSFPEFYSSNNVSPVSLEILLKESDVVTIHVPLTEKTQNLLDSSRLSLMKSGAILINTARGGLVDELALKYMLRDGRLAAAAFDVFAQEPPADTDLLNLPNFLATSHIGGSASEAILAMGRSAIEGLDLHLMPSEELMNG